jgi:hypothetical protein
MADQDSSPYSAIEALIQSGNFSKATNQLTTLLQVRGGGEATADNGIVNMTASSGGVTTNQRKKQQARKVRGPGNMQGSI